MTGILAGTFGSYPSSATVPSAPIIGTASRINDTTVDVAFTASSDGGSAITSYTIEGRRVDTLASISLTRSDPTDLTSPIRVTMTPVEGIDYEFRISATNAIGTSSFSAWSNDVTVNPFDPPGIPGSRIATVINTTTVDVGFTAPASDLTITSYTITSTPSITLTRTDPSDLTSPIRVTGSFSNAGTPGAPTSVSPIASDSIQDQFDVGFTPPTNTGGTSYVFNISATSAAGTGSSGATGSVTPNPASIVGYTITSSPAITLTYNNTDTTSPITISGAFATNTSYTFTISARNANGTGTGTNFTYTPDPRRLCTSAQITTGCCASTSNCFYFGAGTTCATINYTTSNPGAC